MKPKGVLLLSGLILILSASFLMARKKWTETTFEDFADGQFSAALYASDTGVAGNGAVQWVQTRDIDKDGHFDFVISSSHKGTFDVPAAGDYGFHFDNRILVDSLFGWNGSGNLVVDYDNDGNPDVILSAYDNQASQTNLWTHIYYGPTWSRRDSIFTGYHCTGISAADLNNDGLLDLVISRLTGKALIVYQGGDTVGISCAQNYANAIGDIDNDGDLDIILAGSTAILYRGPDFTESATIPGIDSLTDVSIADIDNDNDLDLLFSAFGDTSYVVLGPSLTSRNTMITSNARGISVARLNSDDDLDVLVSNYGTEGHSENSLIFYGPNPGSTAGTPLFSQWAIGNMVGDYNVDGTLDICITNSMLTVDSSYDDAYSYIYYGPDYNTFDSVRAPGASMSTTMDLGNIYDRSNHEYYVSSVFDAERTADWDSITYLAQAPAGSEFMFYIQTGDTAVPDTSWSGWLNINTGDTLPDSLASRYIRYRVMLGTNYLQCARIEEVTIGYPSLPDVLPDTLLSPDPNSIPTCGTYPLLVRVVNMGEDSAVFPVHAILDSMGTTLYDSSIIKTLGVNDTEDVFFSNIYFCPGDSLWVITEMPGDVDPSNDTLFAIIGAQGMEETVPERITTLSVPSATSPVEIKYTLANNENVLLSVYDATGRLIVSLDEGSRKAGQHLVTWNSLSNSGKKSGPGVYFVRLETSSATITRKLVLVK
jgi:hypothetical protein